MLTAMMPSCSARSSSIAWPNRPNPALLTTNSTSAPSAAKAAAIVSQASGCSRSQAIKIGAVPPAATISLAIIVRRSPRRSTRASRWPFDAKTRASSVPMPADAPVISVTQSVMHRGVRRDKGHLQAGYQEQADLGAMMLVEMSVRVQTSWRDRIWGTDEFFESAFHWHCRERHERDGAAAQADGRANHRVR